MVCKLIPKNKTFHRLAVKKEFEILSKIDHDNIVKCYHYIELGTYEGYLMECLPIDLFKYLKFNFPEVSIKPIKDWVKSVALTIKFLHEEKKIAHFDIKPENIGILSEDQAILMDFGLSADLKTLNSKEIQNIWSNRDLLYLAPEVRKLTHLLKEPQIPLDEKYWKNTDWCKVDIFALGVTLFSSLFFVSPFKDGNSSKNDP